MAVFKEVSKGKEVRKEGSKWVDQFCVLVLMWSYTTEVFPNDWFLTTKTSLNLLDNFVTSKVNSLNSIWEGLICSSSSSSHNFEKPEVGWKWLQSMLLV